ncbi:MAG: glycogen debranching enzyme GlgX, partial [Acidimicrobiales bacterium]
VKGLKPSQLYGYRVDGPYAPEEGHRFNINKLLIDPYARDLFGEIIQNDAIFGYDLWRPEQDLSFDTRDSAPFMPKCVAVGKSKTVKFKKPKTSWDQTFVYEAHVKGLTKRHKGVKPACRGTFSGLHDPTILKHFKKIGVTAIELLPVQSFFSEPRLTQMGLTNYWGYNPVNYFAAHTDYGNPEDFKSAVKSLHAAGIEVILDVVYNHTAESDELGPTLSYRGIDNASYYVLRDEKRHYVNHTGTGNTLDMTHPQVLALTISSLRYWVEDMGVDGFRFDLASTLARGPDGFDRQSDFLVACRNDPVLSNCKLIAEPWDIGPGGYVLGQFPKNWCSWNDRFRDDVRSFWRGDEMAHKALAARLLGSADIFDHSGKSANSSINFITSHDGFTLRDVVSYNEKHNAANGENNRDGHGHNLSDNMGVEGPTEDTAINAARLRRQKNLLATLMLSQGTPMLLAGDEFGHSQSGNNNSYCQDNEITWLDWDAVDDELQEFMAELAKLRKKFPQFSQSQFLHGELVGDSGARNAVWISPNGDELHGANWDDPILKCFGLVLNIEKDGAVLIIINAGPSQKFKALSEADWTFELSTANAQNHGDVPADGVTVYSLKTPYLTAKRKQDVLREKARRYGLVESYRDISGHVHVTDDATLTSLLGALGTIPAQTYPDAAEITPVYGTEMLREHGGVWGVTCSLYGLRSIRNWGIGDFEDLAVLAEYLATRGANFIGLNPVHALFPSASHLYAPYSPSSREFLNVMHIAPDKIPELNDQVIDRKMGKDTELIDYAKVYREKSKAFELAFKNFQTFPKSHERRNAFEVFCKKHGEALNQQALFDVLFEQLPKNKQTFDGYHNFAKKYRDPQSADCRKFAAENETRLTYYKYLQWIAHSQLEAAQARAKKAGMRIGLYLDFAVGVVPGGADAWRYQDIFAHDVSLGAPGDKANPDGQVWNLLPFNPHALIVRDLNPLRRALLSLMSLGGAVRIDHVLGLLRSFWVPQSGGSGAYIRYPFDALLALIAEISQREKCVVFGEDLGTVPDGFRDHMAAWEMMGYTILLIERTSSGDIIPLQDVRELAITGFSNHDFPTLSGFWAGQDFDWREELGIGNDPAALSHEKSVRAHDRSILAKLAGLGVVPSNLNAESMAKLQAWLARSPSLAFAVQLDDIMLEAHQANVPGTTDEQPNWRRRSKLSLEELASNPDCSIILDAISAARKSKKKEQAL